MNKEEIFRQVYDDFFGDKSIEARNAKLSKEIDELTKKIKSIEGRTPKELKSKMLELIHHLFHMILAYH